MGWGHRFTPLETYAPTFFFASTFIDVCTYNFFCFIGTGIQMTIQQEIFILSFCL